MTSQLYLALLQRWTLLTKEFIEDLQRKMSLTRLAKTGLFQKLKLEGDEPEEIQKLIKLHRAVLDKALIDSFSVVDRIRTDVEYWLKLTNKDFIEACDRAMLEPELVYKTFHIMKEVLKGQNAAFKRFGKRPRE